MLSAGSVANRCTMVSASSRSRSASTKEGYLNGARHVRSDISIQHAADVLHRYRSWC